MDRRIKKNLVTVLQFTLIELLVSSEVAHNSLAQMQSQWQTNPNSGLATTSIVSQSISSSITQQVRTPRLSSQNQFLEWIKQNQALVRALGIPCFFLFVYLMVLWKRPLWLLVIPAQVKIPQFKIEITPKIILWLKYRDRVLNSWVNENLNLTRQRFNKRQTVQDREIHIPIQVTLDGESVDKLDEQKMKSLFNREICLLIVGEGGTGKTSIACQIAQWGMADAPEERLCPSHQILPVLIEQELDEKTLIAEIKEQLPRSKQEEFIPDELLKILLRKRRIMVIIDRLSEMNESTYQKIRKSLSEFPINALVITSRIRTKDLGIANKTILELLHLQGNKLADFVMNYLKYRGKGDILQGDEEYFDACRRLSRLVMESLQTVTFLLLLKV